jgi:thiol-disulfide isomerase/thioredoxin
MKSFLLLLLIHQCICSPALARPAAAVTALTRASLEEKLKGQVVCCRECWAEADRKVTPYGTAEDLRKAVQCVANGDPTLLAVADDSGGWIFYELAVGKFKRPGKNWLEFVGKHVEITGATRSSKIRRTVKVDSLIVLASPELPDEPAQSSVIGTEAQLTLTDLSGIDQSLTAYRGRIVILNFWATWCVPCRKEMPDLAAIQNEFAPLGVQVIGAAADSQDDRPRVMEFIRQTRLNFPIWLGASADDMRRFGLGSALPGTVIIGRDGKIAGSIRGIVSRDDLVRQLRLLLGKSSSPDREEIASARSRRASNVPS